MAMAVGVRRKIPKQSQNRKPVGSPSFLLGDKNQFPGAVLAQALVDTRAKMGAVIEALRVERWTPEQSLRHWIATMVAITGEHRSLLRAVLQHSLSQPQAWHPVRQFGRDGVEQLIDLLAQSTPPLAVADWPSRMRVALQVVHGTLLNMVINDPGPLTFKHSATTAQELATLVIRYVWADRS